MTNMMRWEYESRQTLEKILHYYIDEAARTGRNEEKLASIKEKLSRDMDLFKIMRVRFRHDIIFRCNSKVTNNFDNE